MEIDALIDTGCSRSILSRKACRGIILETVQQHVTTMSGDDVLCQDAATVNVNVMGVVLELNCLVYDILPQYHMLLGMDAISRMGGVYVNDREFVFGKNVAAVSSESLNESINKPTEPNSENNSIVIEDVDFSAEFSDGKWIVKWVYEKEPEFHNSISQYKVPEEAKGEFCKELDNWIEDGWLQPYDGDVDAVIPLMAVIQKNKSKVRPVMDYRKLNEYVSSHTAESSVCGEKLRSWRRMGCNLSLIDLRKAYLQIHVHPDLWRHQVVKYKGKNFALTRLGFGLSVAPKIMTKILKTVLDSRFPVSEGTDSYIDDIIVNNDIVTNDTVLATLEEFGLVAKPPEKLIGSRVLGLRIFEKEGDILWRRDNVVDEVAPPLTKRKIFSWCGQMVGHYPVGSWLRPACSYLKRIAGDGRWDDAVGDDAKLIFEELKSKVANQDPVMGHWSIANTDVGVIWVDASCLAIGAVVEIDGKIAEDASWLRKPNDANHINLAELEAIIKGLNLAIKWNLKKITMKTDSRTVFAWVTSLLTGDKKIKSKGLSEVLVQRRLSLITDIIKECGLTFTIDWIRTEQNAADSLTRVPQRWFKRSELCNVSNVPANNGSGTNISRQDIQSIHEESHFGVEKTCFFVKKHFPEAIVDKSQVKQVVSNCEKCLSVDPASRHWEEGHLHVDSTWSRLALDVTHVEGCKFLTVIDCGPSRFAIWRKITNESSLTIINELDQIYREFGPPSELLLDNAQYFRSEEFQRFCAKWKVNVIFRCAYRPSGNGIIERNHRTIKRMAARSGKSVLDMVRLYNLAPNSASNNFETPFEQLFLHDIRYPLQFNNELEEDFESTFVVGEKVFVKPANGKCDSEWPTGVVTKILSRLSVEVDGFPRHVSHIRSCPRQANDKCINNCREIENNDFGGPCGTSKFVEITPLQEESSQIADDNDTSSGTMDEADLLPQSDLNVFVGESCNSEELTSADVGSCRPVRTRLRPKRFDDYVT